MTGTARGILDWPAAPAYGPLAALLLNIVANGLPAGPPGGTPAPSLCHAGVIGGKLEEGSGVGISQRSEAEAANSRFTSSDVAVIAAVLVLQGMGGSFYLELLVELVCKCLTASYARKILSSSCSEGRKDGSCKLRLAISPAFIQQLVMLLQDCVYLINHALSEETQAGLQCSLKVAQA